VADELYGRSLPVVVLDEATYSTLTTGETVAVGEDGSLNRPPIRLWRQVRQWRWGRMGHWIGRPVPSMTVWATRPET